MNGSAGCSKILIYILIFSIVFLYKYIDEFMNGDSRKIETHKYYASYWTESTVKYFEEFHFDSLRYKPSDICVEKFIVIRTNSDIYDFDYSNRYSINNVLSLRTLEEYDTLSYFKSKFNRDIDSVTTIIWIDEVHGERYYGVYNGIDAIRLESKINFIDKNSRQIFKIVKIPHEGSLPHFIQRKNSNNKPYVFGAEPSFYIYNTLEKAIHCK